MTYRAEIVADSRAYGVRLTSILATFPRFILAEVNTHRMLSRNSASSRAIPVEKRITSVRAAPFVPEAFAANKRGMQAGVELDERSAEIARNAWEWCAYEACDGAADMAQAGVHKQWANRLLEPFAWHTALLTATEWENFFALRTHTAAQPEFQRIAGMMREAMEGSTPRDLSAGDWHLPFITHADCEYVEGPLRELYGPSGRFYDRLAWEALIKVSVGRCAATSYERSEDTRPLSEWIALHDKLLPVGHLSPFEHQAQVIEPIGKEFGCGNDLAGNCYPRPFAPIFVKTDKPGDWEVSHYACGNLRAPFLQYRKTLPGEAVWVPR